MNTRPRPAPIRLGTGCSQTALRRGRWVKSRLREQGEKVKLVTVRTAPASQWPSVDEDRAVLTRRIQRALRKHRIDIAVQSANDLPLELDDGLALQAIAVRENPRDVLLSRHFNSLEGLPCGATIDAGNPVRMAQILRCRQDLKVSSTGGHLEFRLNKLFERHWDAILVEAAELIQFDVKDQIATEFNETDLMPVVGQGAVALQTRCDDIPMLDVVTRLNDEVSYCRVIAEREMLIHVRAQCSAPVAAWTHVGGDILSLEGVIFSSDGKKRTSATSSNRLNHMKSLGREVAHKLLAAGVARF